MKDIRRALEKGNLYLLTITLTEKTKIHKQKEKEKAYKREYIKKTR